MNGAEENILFANARFLGKDFSLTSLKIQGHSQKIGGENEKGLFFVFHGNAGQVNAFRYLFRNAGIRISKAAQTNGEIGGNINFAKAGREFFHVSSPFAFLAFTISGIRGKSNPFSKFLKKWEKTRFSLAFPICYYLNF